MVDRKHVFSCYFLLQKLLNMSLYVVVTFWVICAVEKMKILFYFSPKHYALRRRDCTALHSWRMTDIIGKLENSSFKAGLLLGHVRKRSKMSANPIYQILSQQFGFNLFTQLFIKCWSTEITESLFCWGVVWRGSSTWSICNIKTNVKCANSYFHNPLSKDISNNFYN